MAKSGEEIVYEGWLTKSPPTQRIRPPRILRARWRRRWFSLRHSRDIPNQQYILTYYADRNCRKLKGFINLDECEQVDLGLKLDKRKLKFDHVFDIKTPTRTYYLAADTEHEMKSWVNCICNVCGLKSTSDEEDLNNTIDVDITYEEEKEENRAPNHGTPPISPVSTSPYIPISQCITGKTPTLTSEDFKTIQHNMRNAFNKSAKRSIQVYSLEQPTYLNCLNDAQDPRFYDCPRVLSTKPLDLEGNKKSNNSPLQSPTDTDSVFTDDDMTEGTVTVTEKFTKPLNPPPRPPKSVHLPASNYINLYAQAKNDNPEEDRKPQPGGGITDDMYDFPRPHQPSDVEIIRNTIQRRHCYNNAAPVKVEGQVFRYDISPKPSTSQVFRYDEETEPASPLSQTSSTTTYSNLPSPLLTDGLMPPPIVNRDLKPRRKLSDTLSSCSNPEPSSPRGAPSVDRKLKPPTPLQELRKMKTVPSPILGRSHESLLTHSHPDEQIYHYLPVKMQYLDLDLETSSSSLTGNVPTLTKSVMENNTVYKKVDFEKTEAFNITRNNLEKERKEPVTFLKK